MYEIKPFRFWCQKVLPLVYDDSLSYMELLCKIVTYLNNVINDVNQIPAYIQSLLTDEKLKEIFDEALDDLRAQLAVPNEGEKTTASADRSAGDLLWLNGKLIQITRDILAGTEYIEETDTEGITGNFVYVTFESLIGNLYELTTDNTTNLVYAINEVLSTLHSIAGDLDNLDTETKTNLVSAINEVLATANALAGDLNNLDTETKTNLVSAINEVYTKSITYQRHSVKEFGAKGDGTTDDTQAFITGLSLYDSLYVPEGHYVITSITIPKGKALYGDFSPEGSQKNGSWLYCTDTSTEAIILNDGCTIDGINFYYPNQTYNDSPTVYPATIKIGNGADRVTLTNIYLSNSYIGVDAQLSHEYLSIKRMYGYCIYKGIIDCNSTDIDRLETIHFNPNTLNQIYNSTTVGLYNQWCRTNGIAFILEHDDWILCFDLFCFGYSIGLQISETISSNPMGRAKFTNCGFDACGRTVYIIGASGKSHNGLVFDSCFFTANKSTNSSDSPQYESVRIDYAIDVTFNSCRFWNTLQGAIVSGHCSSLNVTSCFFEEIGTSGTSDTIYEAIYVTSDTTYCNISNNTFFFENYYCNAIHLKSQTYGVVNGNGFININSECTAIIVQSCNYLFLMFNTFQSVTTAFSFVSSNNITYSDENHIIHTRGGISTIPINSTNVYKGSFYINENQAPCFKDMNGNVHTITYT